MRSSKFNLIVGNLYRDGKIGVAESAALLAAMECFCHEMEFEGSRMDPYLVKKYGTQIREGMGSLNKYVD